MSWVRFVIAGALVAGCGRANTLLVQVRSDLSDAEMSGVGVALVDGDSDGEWDYFVPADGSRNWVTGVRVAELTGLPSGPLSFRVGADAPDGTRLVERRVRVELAGGLRIVTVLLTRDCVGVECPTATACLAGSCVDPSCSSEASERCPEPECAADSACVPEAWAPACAARVCLDGFCATRLADGNCGARQACLPSGCVDRVDDSTDAGADAGPVDAGSDAGVDAGGMDAGVDAGGMDAGVDAGGMDAGVDAGSGDAGPLDAGVPPDFVELTAGASHTCARLASGAVRCWGRNNSGQLGDGTRGTDRLLPVAVMNVTGAVELTAGVEHTCARLGSGEVHCWGWNNRGQVGAVSAGDHPLPVAVMNVTGAVELAAASTYTCARLLSGDVRCWGDHAQGTGVTDAVELTAGGSHTCARLSSGAVHCWGSNRYGQLGDDTSGDRRMPMPVMGVTHAVELTAGLSHTCARLNSGEVRCWGRNGDGQLGDVTSGTDRLTPVAVMGVADAVELTAGSYHTCARLDSGEVRCWGRNDHGQLGDGTSGTDRLTPVAVTGIRDAVELTAGADHTCARLASGEVRCWGDNGAGQLGDGTSGTDRRLPVLVRGRE